MPAAEIKPPRSSQIIAHHQDGRGAGFPPHLSASTLGQDTPMFQFPKEPKKIRERLMHYERALRKEYETFGAHDDGFGKRAPPQSVGGRSI
jgi:hypothetical protein